MTLDATARGLNLFEPTTTLGLWTFADRLDGDRDYRQVVPVTPVAAAAVGPGAGDAARRSAPYPAAHTGLYDSVLGLYEEARQNWEPGKLNVVVVLTDGHNDDPVGHQPCGAAASPGRRSPTRPVPSRSSGWRSARTSTRPRWTQIARATGGRSFVVTDPGRIAAVFFAALGALSKG